jgi:hypothetical protein
MYSNLNRLVGRVDSSNRKILTCVTMLNECQVVLQRKDAKLNKEVTELKAKVGD